MNKKELDCLFKEVFNFLIIDYNFSVQSSKKDNFGYKLIMVNSTTGVEVKYEFREADIHIVLYRLTSGRIVNNINEALITNEPMEGFGLGWIINFKNSDAQIKPAYEYSIASSYYDKSSGLKNYAKFVAGRLKEFADDILRGDFSIFSDLDYVVKENYKRHMAKPSANDTVFFHSAT